MLRSAASKVMWVGRATVLLVGLAVILAVVLGTATAAFAALSSPGDPFKLGVVNEINRLTTLMGARAGAMLKVDNNGTGPALQLQSEAGVPPLVVNANAGTATGLKSSDSDKLDGKDSSAFQGKYAQTVVVAKSGGDFNSVQAALNSITDASATKRYLVWVGPGTYNERVQMKPYVDIEGAGELATRITASGGGTEGPGSSVVSGASDAELRHLTAENTGGNTVAIGIYNGSASPRLSNVTATGDGAAESNRGVVNANSSPTMTDVTATASGGSSAFGVHSFADSSPTMTDVIATASGSPYNVGVNNAGSSPTMTDVTAAASGGDFARGMENSGSSPKMTNVSVTASGGSSENTGLYNYLHSSPTIRESVISASGTASRGVWSQFPDDTTSLVTIENSEVKGATGTVRVEGGYKTNVGASKLDGGAVFIAGTGSEVKCAGVHDENYVFFASTCP